MPDYGGGLEPLQVTVTNLSGERFELSRLPPETSLRELKESIKEQWGYPVAAQRLALGIQTVDVEDREAIGRTLRRLSGEPDAEAVELTCIWGAIPEALQATLDHQLLRATASGDHKAMAKALSEGARANVAESRQVPPLMIAIAAEDQPACDILRRARAEEPDMRPWLNSLGQAFGRHDLAEVVRLLADGADPNCQLWPGEGIQDTSRGVPLHACCAQHSHPDAAAVAELLCRLGADLMATDGEGDSPLSHARYFGAREIYEILEARGAKVQGFYYSTAFVAGRRLFGMG